MPIPLIERGPGNRLRRGSPFSGVGVPRAIPILCEGVSVTASTDSSQFLR